MDGHGAYEYGPSAGGCRQGDLRLSAIPPLEIYRLYITECDPEGCAACGNKHES